jgi:hypothetical protein
MKKVVARSLALSKEGSAFAGPTYNYAVHGKMLALAMDFTLEMRCVNISMACIYEECKQTGADNVIALSNWSAFAMFLLPTEAASLFDFDSQTKGKLVVSNSSTTTHRPARSTPGNSQLRVWVSALYKRLYSLFGPQTPIITIPFLVANAERWELYFACQKEVKGGGADLCGPIDIGDTTTVQDAYMVLAVLRVLVHWTDTTFRAWARGKLDEARVLQH